MRRLQGASLIRSLVLIFIVFAVLFVREHSRGNVGQYRRDMVWWLTCYVTDCPTILVFKLFHITHVFSFCSVLLFLKNS